MWIDVSVYWVLYGYDEVYNVEINQKQRERERERERELVYMCLFYVVCMDDDGFSYIYEIYMTYMTKTYYVTYMLMR